MSGNRGTRKARGHCKAQVRGKCDISEEESFTLRKRFVVQDMEVLDK